ncbi:vitamin K epoxide reductase family protein [Candidatus Woesearchaeota archaeon]|nr:vitamin K epoxide reductase family protein [Candidatus Woesearchaeota archaeon]
MKTERVFHYVILVLAAIGLALSLYLFNMHLNPVDSSFCDINAKVSCNVVDQSPYSELFGVPVSLFGIIYWFGVLCVVLIPQRLTKLIALGDRKLFQQAFVAYMILGFLFSLYLTFIQAFVLHAWCPLCVLDAFAVTITLVLAIILARVKY